MSSHCSPRIAIANCEQWYIIFCIFPIFLNKLETTLGTRDFFSAVFGFFQVFIVTRAKSFSRGLAARGFGLRPKMCRPSANTENSRRTREKPLGQGK